MLELAVIAIYIVLVLVIGLTGRAKKLSLDEYFVAGRKGSTLFIVGSLLATIVGGSATIGMAGMGFSQGLTGAWWLLSGSVGLLALGVFFARKVREFGLYTLPELVGRLYGKRIALAASVLIVIAWLGVVAGQIIAAGTILEVLGVMDARWWMVGFSVVFIVYTLLGGQRAVIRTDILQTGIIFLGVFLGLGLMLYHFGGLQGLADSVGTDRLSFPLSETFSVTDLVRLLLLVGLTYVVGPDMYSRIFCARDSATARKSVFWTAAGLVPFALAIAVIGVGAAALFPEIAPEQAFPSVMKGVLPPVVSGIVLAALVCAVMSSADTTLLSASTILAVDVIGAAKPSLDEKSILLISRICVVVLGILSLVMALLLKGVISALLFAYTIYSSGVILPVIFGFYREKLKLTSNGALAAIIGGGGIGLVSKFVSVPNLDIAGLAASVVLLFLVSYIERAVTKKD